jgi:hypothetical protein
MNRSESGGAGGAASPDTRSTDGTGTGSAALHQTQTTGIDGDASFDDQLLNMFIQEQKDQYGADRPVGEILEALEKRVANVITTLESGGNYEENPIDQAIVTRRFTKRLDYGGGAATFRPLGALHPQPIAQGTSHKGTSYGEFFDSDDDLERGSDDDMSVFSAVRGISPRHSPIGQPLQERRYPHQVPQPFNQSNLGTVRGSNNTSQFCTPVNRGIRSPEPNPCPVAGICIAIGGPPAAAGSPKQIRHRWRLQRFFLSLLAYYYAIPLFFVFLIVMIFYFAPLKICNVACPCDVGESFAFTMSYGLALNFPRCLFMAALSEVMIFAKVETGPQRPMWDVVPFLTLLRTRIAVILLAVFSTFFYLLLVGPAASLPLPNYVFRPIVIIAAVLPYFVYALVNRAAHVAAVVALVHVLPFIYGLIVVEYGALGRQSPQFGAFLAVWPLLVALIDRIVIKAISFLLPTNRTPFAVKLMLAHASVFYAQSVLAALFITLDPENQPVVVAFNLLLWVSIECLLSTRAIELGLVMAKEWLLRVCFQEKWEHLPVPATDFVRLAMQTRSLTALLALVLLIPSLGFQRFPDILSSQCGGKASITYVHWVCWMMGLGATSVAYIITSAHRWRRGKLRLPLGLLSPPWSVLAALYFATLSVNASGAIPN